MRCDISNQLRLRRRAGRDRATSAAGASRADPRCGRRGGRSRESSPCAPAWRGRPPRPSRAGASAPISSSSRITSAFAPPCSGPFSAPIARDDRRVDVGERGRRDARGERRRVQLVIGVQDQRDVERARRQAARPLAGQHVEEIRRVAEHRIRLDRPAAALHPAHRRDERADLRGQPDGLAVVGLRRVVGGVGIVVAERGRQRPQRVHARCRPAAPASAAGPARAAAARRPAATAGRRARRASAAAGATAGSRPLRTSRAARDRGCRSRSTRARRDRRRDSRSPTRSRRCLRAPLWASRPWSYASIIPRPPRAAARRAGL